MKPIFRSILLIFLLFYLSSCKEECSEYLLGDLIIYNPLNGSETLIFIDSDGVEYSFFGNGRRNWLSESEGYEGCEILEMDNTIFSEINENYTIMISVRPSTHYRSVPDIVIYFMDYTYSSSHYLRSHISLDIPLDKNNLGVDQYYYDSLLIHNTVAYDVFAAVPQHGSMSTAKEALLDTIHPSLIYYNADYGVVKIDFDDNSSWELKEILN